MLEGSANNQPRAIFAEIPEMFYSTYNDGLFETCLCCSEKLLKTEQAYVINKKYVGSECVFEYAICTPCHTRIAKRMSSASLQNIGNFFSNRVNIEKRILDKLCTSLPINIKHWIGRCILCSIKLSQTSKFNVMALCQKDTIVCAQYPMMVCEICEGQMQEMVSLETRKSFDDFIGTYFDCPPNIEAPYPQSPNILV